MLSLMDIGSNEHTGFVLDGMPLEHEVILKDRGPNVRSCGREFFFGKVF